ncbi:YebC/PmpR family DNA-binding transcriptional regulator [Candidatus Gottesmanbacteria bacterium]|nr:YebC/PmpR family DNA-binding transcriptional regulator [Candidatus Gottesmanbacteria bacterium]MBI5451840.1 YebC/PmpR family DNA-binding transcriptional regulator [Candidatus Gottesmanbacteria bacterium]
MSGHSKWSKVKHQKETTDAAKGKVFTKFANAITIAVGEGGSPDPNFNFKLRLAIDKARSYNMPKENIERAIERARGGEEGGTLQEAVYEAFAPGGVGVIIEAATNNKQRTVSELKNILERGGGVLAASGSVSHFFKYVGLITVAKDKKSFDEIMEAAINAGATDISDAGEYVEIFTEPSSLHKIKEALIAFGLSVSSSELDYHPITTIPIEKKETAAQILKLLSAIEDMDDVQKVYANFDIPDEYIK